MGSDLPRLSRLGSWCYLSLGIDGYVRLMGWKLRMKVPFRGWVNQLCKVKTDHWRTNKKLAIVKKNQKKPSYRTTLIDLGVTRTWGQTTRRLKPIYAIVLIPKRTCVLGPLPVRCLNHSCMPVSSVPPSYSYERLFSNIDTSNDREGCSNVGWSPLWNQRCLISQRRSSILWSTRVH